MITLEQIQEELTRYRYKPSTTITARQSYAGDNPFELIFTAYVPDVRSSVDSEIHSVEIIHFENFCSLEPFEVTFRRLLENLIQRFERHEFKEWFQYDSECVYDPHPN